MWSAARSACAAIVRNSKFGLSKTETIFQRNSSNLVTSVEINLLSKTLTFYFAKNKEISATTLSLPALTDLYACFALLFRT